MENPLAKSEGNDTPGAQDRALARYAAVSWVCAQVAGGEPLAASLRAASNQLWNGARYSAQTLERYYYRYRRGGFGALVPAARADRGSTKALSTAACERLCQLRLAHPDLHVTRLVEKLVEENLLEPATSRSSIYRFLARTGLDRRTLRAAGPGGMSGPTKAFEHPLPNLLWMADMMHGPILREADSSGTIRTRLFAIIDDYSRLCPAAQYFACESTLCFWQVLRDAVSRRGVPDKLYTDNGGTFTCRDTQLICANLGIKLIHARPYAAWSKGKIERYFRTVQSGFQQQLALRPVHSLEQLNERFWIWMEHHYHRNGQLPADQTPAAKFAAHAGAVRPAPAEPELSRLFWLRQTRRVRRDATVTLAGRWFETSPALRGQMIELRFNPFAPESAVEVWHAGKLFGPARRLDKHTNARSFASSLDYGSF